MSLLTTSASAVRACAGGRGGRRWVGGGGGGGGGVRVEAASQGHFQISLVGLSCGREAS